MKKFYNAPEIMEIVSLDICDVITTSQISKFRLNDSTGDLDNSDGFIDRTVF